MTKVIKLPKDRLGNAYYPATVTDAIVHPTKKQSLTEIIDNIKDVKIVDSVDKLDPNAQQGSLAAVAIDAIGEVPFSELYQPTSDEVNVGTGVVDTTNLSRVSGIAINSSYDTSATVVQFYLHLIDINLQQGNIAQYIVLDRGGSGKLIDATTFDVLQSFSLFALNDDGSVTINNDGLDDINNILSSTEFVYGGTVNPMSGAIIDPSYADLFYKTTFRYSGTELYIKDSEGWKVFDEELKNKINEIEEKIDSFVDKTDLIVNSVDELPQDAPIGTLANILNLSNNLTFSEVYSGRFESGQNLNTLSVPDNLIVNFPETVNPSTSTTIIRFYTSYMGAGSMVLPGNSWYQINVTDTSINIESWSNNFKNNTISLATYDSLGNRLTANQENIELAQRYLRSSYFPTSISESDLNSLDRFLFFEGTKYTTLYVKNETGWEQYSELVDQSVTTDKVADGAITLDKLSQEVKDSIPNVDTSNFVTASALQTKLNDYSVVGHTHSQYLTEHQDISGKQDTLVSGTTIKTINGSSILGPGNIEILPGNDVDLSGYYSKTEVDATVNAINSRLETIENNPVDISGKQDIISDLEEIRSKASTALQSIPEEYITESELNTKGYLTEHQDISGKQDIIADLQTIRENASKGATALQTIPDEYVTETELIQKGYLTDVSNKQDVIADLDTIRSGAAKGSTALQTIPSEYITETKLNEKGYSTITYVDNKVAALVNGAPETLDTIDELAAALKDNKDIISVLENAIASKSDKSELSSKQDTIADLETIRTNSTNGQTAYNWGNHADAGYLQTIPTEYITETELTNKGYATSASIPTKTSQLTNDSGFITQLKTVMSQSLIGSGNVDLTEAITNAVNNTNIESIKFKGILNVWSDFTKLRSLTDSINVGEVFFCLPSLTDDVMGCMTKETSWRDLPIPTSLSNAVDDVEKYVDECTGGVDQLSPINIHGARAMYPADVFKLGGSILENLSAINAINKLGYYPMILNLDEDVWKTMSFREGDMFCLAKMDYQMAEGIEVPVVLCFTWQIGSANANKYAGYNTLIHRWAPSANQCLKTGVYPWVTLNVPVANNAYTLFVESSTNRDDNGYNTIKQTAYGRQSDAEIYERMLIAKQTQLEYYVPALSSAISQLKSSTKLTCEWNPSDYVCIAYYNGDNKLTHWDMHVIQTMVDNTDAVVNEDNTIQFSSAFCNTVEGKVSLCIVDGMTPGPNGRLYPISYKSTTVGSNVTAMDTLTILGDFAENPNTPWKMTSDAFTSRAGGDANWCLESGVYPWVVGNVPTGNDGAFTLVVHKTASPDGGGYYTIDQTAYGRQGEEQMYVYKRLLFYKPATPGTDEVDVLENGAAWHKINNSNSGGLNITTENGLLSNIKIGYEPGTNVNSIAAQPGSHHCIVDGNSIGYANIDIVSHWNNTHNVTITVVSNHGGITTTYVASAEDIPNDVVRVPGFNNITTWATTNTRTDYIDKTAIIPSVRNNTLAPVLVSKTEFISKYGFDPTNYTNQADYFTAMTDIGLVSNTYINGYGLCEVELIEQDDTYDLCYSFEKARGVTNVDIANGTYTDQQIKSTFGVPFAQLGDLLVIREQIYTVSMLSNYKKVYTNWSENATLNTITIELKDDNYEITKNAFNIS